MEQARDGHAGVEFGTRYVHLRQPFRGLPFFEGKACRFRRRPRGFLPVSEARDLGREDLLRLVDLLALQPAETLDLPDRQLGEEAQEARDVIVLRVAPELPELV